MPAFICFRQSGDTSEIRESGVREVPKEFRCRTTLTSSRFRIDFYWIDQRSGNGKCEEYGRNPDANPEWRSHRRLNERIEV